MERIARTTFLGEVGDQTMTVKRGQKIDPTAVQAKALAARKVLEPLDGDEEPEPKTDPLNPTPAKPAKVKAGEAPKE